MRRLAPVLAVLSIALVGPAAARAFEYGVYYNGPPGADAPGMALVAEQGSEVIRLPFRWNRIQAEPGGSFDWSEWDAQVGLAARHGVRVLANLHGTPEWAASTDPDDGTPNTEAPPTPAHLPAYRDYLEAVVARYGHGGEFWRERPGLARRPIEEWEIHNEPNAPRFWTDGEPDPAAYANLVLASGAAISRVDPSAQVIVGSTTQSCARICPDDFLERLFAVPGVSAASDGVAFHAYYPTAREVAEHARAIRRVVTLADAPRTPLHLTEFGWGRCGATEPERGVCVDDRAQARLLTRSFELLRAESPRTRLATAHWFIEFDLEPCREPAAFFCTFGLVDVGPKGAAERTTAWHAYRGLAGR